MRALLATFALLAGLGFAATADAQTVGPSPGGGGGGSGSVTSLTAGTGLSASPATITTTGSYSLLNATTTRLGGVVVGSGLAVSNTGVLSATSSGGGSLAVTATSGNTNFQPLFSTGTGASVSTIYVDPASPLTYNPSTGLLSSLGLTSTSLTVNGNASLSGTTTLGTAQIGAGNATLTTLTATTVTGATINGSNASLTGTTTLSSAQILGGNALVTTITSTTDNTTTLKATNAAISGTTTTGNLTVTGTCVGCGAAFTPVLQPLSVTTTDTSGTVFPYTYFDSTATGAVAVGSPSWGTAASMTTTASLRYRFKMPPTLPATGTLNLCTLQQANATSGAVKYTVSDADIAVNNTASVGATVFNSETGTSITWTAADNYVQTCTPLTATPVADHIIAGAVTFTPSGYTLAQILSTNLIMEWR